MQEKAEGGGALRGRSPSVEKSGEQEREQGAWEGDNRGREFRARLRKKRQGDTRPKHVEISGKVSAHLGKVRKKPKSCQREGVPTEVYLFRKRVGPEEN